MARKSGIKWRQKPEDHDYPAAASYLSLLFDAPEVAKYVKQLRKAPLSQYAAKDIFRASRSSLLGVSNAHVQAERKRAVAGEALSPLLLVRPLNHDALIIADGYHRLCAVYSFDENAVIPCKIV